MTSFPVLFAASLIIIESTAGGLMVIVTAYVIPLYAASQTTEPPIVPDWKTALTAGPASVDASSEAAGVTVQSAETSWTYPAVLLKPAA